MKPSDAIAEALDEIDCPDCGEWLCFPCRAEALPNLRAQISRDLVTTISFIDVLAARRKSDRTVNA